MQACDVILESPPTDLTELQYKLQPLNWKVAMMLISL